MLKLILNYTSFNRRILIKAYHALFQVFISEVTFSSPVVMVLYMGSHPLVHLLFRECVFSACNFTRDVYSIIYELERT